MFGVFFFLVILASLLVLWRWRSSGCMLSWRKVVIACGMGSVILFPLGLVFRVDGLCFGTWESASSIIVQYGIFLVALCLSVQALNCVVWYGARHETEWKPWRKWGVMAVISMVVSAWWWHAGFRCSFDFLHRQYPQIVSGQYNLMHTLSHTLLCKGVLSVWPSFQAIVLVQLGLLLAVCFMLVSWAARERMQALIVAGAVLLCLFQFEMMTTVIKDVPYSIFLMALTVGLCSYFLEKRASSLWLIGLGLVGTGCLRYDGAVPFFLTVAALSVHMFHHRGEFPRLAVPVAGGICGWLFAFLVLPFLMDAGSGASGTKYARMAHVVCDIVAEGGKVSAGDMELIEREIMPRDVIMRQYRLYEDSLHPVVSAGYGQKYLHTGLFESWDTGMKYGFAWTLSDKGALVRNLFFSVSADNPLRAAKILLLNSQMVWNLPSDNIRDMPQLSLFYGCVLSFLVYGMMKKRAYLIPFVPFYGVVLAIGAAATTYEVRYMLPLELLFPVLLLYSIGCAKRADMAGGREERKPPLIRSLNAPHGSGMEPGRWRAGVFYPEK